MPASRPDRQAGRFQFIVNEFEIPPGDNDLSVLPRGDEISI
jgi:hypothetical protein